MKQSTAMVGGEGNFIFLHPGPRTNDLVYHPLTFRPPQHTRDSSNCPRQLSSLPPPLFRPISTTAFNRFRLVRPPRWEKNPSSSFHRIFSNRFDPDRLIENSKRKRKIQGFFLFFFFLRSVLVELLRSLSTPRNQGGTVVFVSRNPIPQIHGSKESSSIRRADFSTTHEGLER